MARFLNILISRQLAAVQIAHESGSPTQKNLARTGLTRVEYEPTSRERTPLRIAHLLVAKAVTAQLQLVTSLQLLFLHVSCSFLSLSPLPGMALRFSSKDFALSTLMTAELVIRAHHPGVGAPQRGERVEVACDSFRPR